MELKAEVLRDKIVDFSGSLPLDLQLVSEDVRISLLPTNRPRPYKHRFRKELSDLVRGKLFLNGTVKALISVSHHQCRP